MFSYILMSLGAVGLVFLYQIDAHNIAKNAVVDRYHRFRKLNKLVATKYTGIGLIVYHSLCLVASATWLSFVQYLNNSVRKVDRHRFEISYVINGKTYKMIVRPMRGPKAILLACDQNGKDVTDLIVPYLGPRNDFHGTSLTPEFFGMEKISLETSEGDNLEFSGKETISLKPKEN